jgi:hypothetical protein
MIPLHEHFPYGLCNSSRAHTEALAAHRVGKEIASEYYSDSNPTSSYYSDSSYEFDFGSDPTNPKSKINKTEEPLSGPATGLVITSTPAGRFVSGPTASLQTWRTTTHATSPTLTHAPSRRGPC